MTDSSRLRRGVLLIGGAALVPGAVLGALQVARAAPDFFGRTVASQ